MTTADLGNPPPGIAAVPSSAASSFAEQIAERGWGTVDGFLPGPAADELRSFVLEQKAAGNLRYGKNQHEGPVSVEGSLVFWVEGSEGLVIFVWICLKLIFVFGDQMVQVYILVSDGVTFFFCYYWITSVEFVPSCVFLGKICCSCTSANMLALQRSPWPILVWVANHNHSQPHI